MKKIAIYGSGNIGACLATLTSGNGYPTVVIGHSEKGLERCRQCMEQNWNDLISEGVAKEKNKSAAMKLANITNDAGELAGSEVVFEAVSEDLSTKEEVYRQITRYCGLETTVASTTSSFDAEILARRIENPRRFLIAHPFQPAHMLPLVEVVRNKETSEQAVHTICELLQDLSRQIVLLSRSVPGFLVNRFAQALFRESIYLIEEGITTAADIDRAIKYAVGMRYASIGLLEYYDAVGFELEQTIAGNVYPSLCETKEVQRITLEGIAAGHTGQKSGIGLYDWSRKDPDDFRRRKQAPYLNDVSLWHMPE